MYEVKITHRAPTLDNLENLTSFEGPARRGKPHSKEDMPTMEWTTTEELKAHLLATDDEFRRLADEHTNYARKVDQLESLPHLTAQEEMEEQRLKKLKLRLKDQMEIILHRHREHVH